MAAGVVERVAEAALQGRGEGAPDVRIEHPLPPHPVRPGLAGTTFERDIDAAVEWIEFDVDTRYIYLFKGDQCVEYDFDKKQGGRARDIGENWPGLGGTDFAGAQAPVVTAPAARATYTITFTNPDDGEEPESYGKVWLTTEDGVSFRLWT
ncbi:hemopexin repeat-containing protein [Streptomyces sp. CA-132043]|uniref:hemopexin repeat-containing protein n=1 Tax=Streptomyces sp. CA-132043 TaxID=3240048 RepID=UPI003D8D37AE